MRKHWEGVRVVHMPTRPKKSEVVYGITRSMIAKVAGLDAAEAERLPMDRLGDVIMALARRQARNVRGAAPCRNPRSSKAPRLDSYWSTYTLVYSPALDDASSIPREPPSQAELEHAAEQLAAFGTRARVVGEHVVVGRDRYSLWDARRLCVICESMKRPGEAKRPADRRAYIKLLSALAR